MCISRCLETAIRQDLEKKIVLLAGPRQVGRTTLSRYYAERLKPEHAIQVVHELGQPTQRGLIQVTSAERWLSDLER